MSEELKANAALLTEAIDALTSCDDVDYRIDMMLAYRPEIVSTLRALLSALTAANARAEAAEARVGYLQIIIDCVVANCEASASSYQERIETIHRVTSALALEWAGDCTLKGTPDGR